MGLAYLLAHMIASIWIANVRNAIENWDLACLIRLDHESRKLAIVLYIPI